MTTPALLLALVTGAWIGLAIAATWVSLRRTARADRARSEGRVIADLLAGAPAVPLLVHAHGALDADPRVAGWLGLERVPVRLEQLAPAIGDAALAALMDEIDAARGAGRTVERVVTLPGTQRAYAIRGGPYSVPRARGAVLLWLIDVSALHHDVARLEAQGARLGRALDGLSGLIEAAPFPMWHRGPDMSLALVNGAYVRAIEADTAADVIARGMELIETGNGPSPQASAAAARERAQVTTRTAPAIVAGQRRLMRVTDVPIGEAGVAGYAIDIQELAEARAELGLFERAQRDMLDRLSAGVAQFASDHSLVFYNRHFARLFALAPEWLAERPAFDRVLEAMRETQRAPESRDFPSWKAERRGWFSTTEPLEEQWLLPGGTHLRVVAQPLPDRGLLLICEDRTEHLQLASARDTLLRVRTATFDNLFEAVGVFAADGRLHLWNNRFREVWDLTEEELTRHPRVDALAQAIAPRLLDPTKAGLVRDLVRIATIERQHRSGRISLLDGRHFEFAAVPLPDGNALFTLLDITASRGIEAALRDRNEALEEANRLKNAFVGSMSYELRVPLTTIAGFAELLAGGYAGELPATAREYIDAIQSAVQRLGQLTGDALDLTQSAAGSLPMALEPLAVADLVRGAAELVREQARAAGLTLAADVAPDSGTVSGDRRRLAQSLDHLFRNAIAHTPAGGRVLLRSRIVDAQAEIVISDNGPGIPPKLLARLFDRLDRATMGAEPAEPVGAEGEEPRGFGLPLARQLVEAHGGTLDVLSEVGGGTSVVIRLPLRPEGEGA